MINLTGIKSNSIITKKPIENQETQTVPVETKQEAAPVKTVSANYAMAALGIQKSPSFGGNKNAEKEYVDNLSFADKLSPQDKRNLVSVLKKKDDETEYTQKMIEMITDKKVNPYAVSSLCKHGEMSNFAKSDIDIYYDKVLGQNMSVEDAFVPKHTSVEKGQNAVNVGDVFRVDGQDEIYVKSGDGYSRQIKMDAETYVKLFPPVERFSSTQGSAGDCYLLSSINAIMENPYARASIYDCFTQHGDSVSAQLPNGTAKILCPDCKLPDCVDADKYVDGASGMKILEHLYGVDFEEEKMNQYSGVMKKEFAKLDKELAKWENKKPQDNLALKKQKEIKTKIENYKIGQQKVEEAAKDPNHTLTFVLDDEDNFIMGKFGPMFEECEKLNSEFKFPSDYYRGGLGGYCDIALSRLGFAPEQIEMDDEDEIEDILFAEDANQYIIAAATPPADEGMESPVATTYSVYSSHAYKISPFDDENGERMFKVTNPWNQSHQVIMSYNKIREYFANITAADVKFA